MSRAARVARGGHWRPARGCLIGASLGGAQPSAAWAPPRAHVGPREGRAGLDELRADLAGKVAECDAPLRERARVPPDLVRPACN